MRCSIVGKAPFKISGMNPNYRGTERDTSDFGFIAELPFDHILNKMYREDFVFVDDGIMRIDLSMAKKYVKLANEYYQRDKLEVIGITDGEKIEKGDFEFIGYDVSYGDGPSPLATGLDYSESLKPKSDDPRDILAFNMDPLSMLLKAYFKPKLNNYYALFQLV